MKQKKRNFWFEVFDTGSDGSTETIYRTTNLKKAFDNLKEEKPAYNKLRIDLWVSDSLTKEDYAQPLMAISEKTSFDTIAKRITNSKDVKESKKKSLLAGLKKQF